MGLLRSFCLWHPEEPEVRYVDQDYISKLKLESDTKVSTNDILTSHLLQKSGFGYGYMSINLRNRGLGANESNAGNYVHRIHLAPERFHRPEGVRKSLAGPETLAPPGWWESMTLRHGLVSNWSHFFQEVSWFWVFFGWFWGIWGWMDDNWYLLFRLFRLFKMSFYVLLTSLDLFHVFSFGLKLLTSWKARGVVFAKLECLSGLFTWIPACCTHASLALSAPWLWPDLDLQAQPKHVARQGLGGPTWSWKMDRW